MPNGLPAWAPWRRACVSHCLKEGYVGNAGLHESPRFGAGCRRAALPFGGRCFRLVTMTNVLRQSDVTIIELASNYDAVDDQAVQEFGEVLLGEATGADPPRLVVDLSPADYINSSFLELLVRAWKRIKQRNGVLALCGVHPFCLEVLQATRLNTLWPIHSTREEAVAALADPTERWNGSGEQEQPG